MNKDEIVQNMVGYIEAAEKDLQANLYASDTKGSKSDIVNNILNELDREISNED